MQVKLVLQRNRLFVESPEKKILEKLLEDIDIKAAHEASGNAGIKSGQGRLDIAAAAIATTMRTIDLTKVPQDPEDAGEGGGDATQTQTQTQTQPGLDKRAGAQRAGGDEDDEEAEEAERSFRVATNAAAESGAPSRSRASASASASAAAAGAQQRGNGAKLGPETCEPRPVPHSNQSALPEEGGHVEIFSFEISPLHVRSRMLQGRLQPCFRVHLNCQDLDSYSVFAAAPL